VSEDEVDGYEESFKDSEKDLRRRRRDEKIRKKDKARRVWREAWGMKNSDYEEEFVNTHADNLKSCSCNMCCSPRKSNIVKGGSKLTMQERKFDLFAEQEEDI
jgi:hypothetical protein